MTALQRLTAFSTALLLITATTSFSFNNNPSAAGYGLKDLKGIDNVTLTISGTSTLHDWEMKSDKGRVEVILGVGTNARLTGLAGLKFSIAAESLKSDKTSMDKNAYKALKTGTEKSIVFVLTSAAITQVNESSYTVKAVGNLTIAGKTKETNLTADVKYNSTDKSYTITGAKKINMTEFDVKPPSFMLGSVKTGKDITISFKTKLNR
jgi:hypothetical protein